MSKIMQVPVEVIVKYNEYGQITPLKILFQDEIFVIDKVYNSQMITPRGGFSAALEYRCLIKGKTKNIYFDRYNSKWYVVKEYPGD